MPVVQTKSLHSRTIQCKIGGRNVFEIAMHGLKTAKTTVTGVLWRIGVAGVARLSNGNCFTLERSMTVTRNLVPNDRGLR